MPASNSTINIYKKLKSNLIAVASCKGNLIVKLNNITYQIGLVVLFLLLPASLLYYANPFDHLPGTDNGVFLYGGQQLLAGKTPYLDFWDHKGPLIYFINALGLLLGKGSRWGVWITEFVFLTLTATGIYKIAHIQWSKPAGIVAAAYWAYVLEQVGRYKYFHNSNYTETYSLLFNVTAIYFWVWASKSRRANWSWIAIGVSTGFSFLLRPNNIGVQVSIMLVELVIAISQKELGGFFKKAFFLALGVFSVLAIFATWFLTRGALSNLVDAVFTYNAYYAHKNQVKGFVTSYIEMITGIFNQMGWVPFIGYGALLILWIYGQVKQKTFDASHGNIFILMILIGLPLETVLSSVSGRVFYHYMIIWTPYLALLAGALTKEILAKITPPSLNKFVPPALLTIILTYLVATNLIMLEGYARLGNHFLSHGSESLEAQNVIVQYIDNMTKPDDTVLVWGNNVWINFLTDRASPTRYSYQFPLFMPGYTSEAKVLDFLATLRSSPPALILEPQTDTAEMLPISTDLNPVTEQAQVDMPQGMPLVFQYISENYCIIRRFHDTSVYQLKSTLGCK